MSLAILAIGYSNRINSQVLDTINIYIKNGLHIRKNPIIILKNGDNFQRINSTFKEKDSIYRKYYVVVTRDTASQDSSDSKYFSGQVKQWLLVSGLFRNYFFSFIGHEYFCTVSTKSKLIVEKRSGLHLKRPIRLCFRCSHLCRFPIKHRYSP